MNYTLYHNPRCSKSREALKLLEENKIDFQVIEYLKENLDATHYEKLISELNLAPEKIIRKKETLFGELKIQIDSISNQELAKILAAHPTLLERPILSDGKSAVQGRPPEKILSLCV